MGELFVCGCEFFCGKVPEPEFERRHLIEIDTCRLHRSIIIRILFLYHGLVESNQAFLDCGEWGYRWHGNLLIINNAPCEFHCLDEQCGILHSERGPALRFRDEIDSTVGTVNAPKRAG